MINDEPNLEDSPIHNPNPNPNPSPSPNPAVSWCGTRSTPGTCCTRGVEHTTLPSQTCARPTTCGLRPSSRHPLHNTSVPHDTTDPSPLTSIPSGFSRTLHRHPACPIPAPSLHHPCTLPAPSPSLPAPPQPCPISALPCPPGGRTLAPTGAGGRSGVIAR